MTETTTLSETVLVSLDAGVLTLTLNRPDKLNSLNEEMHFALRAGLQRAADDAGVRAVLLTGSGRGFCAGADLGDRDPRKERPDLAAIIERLYNPTLRLIRSLEKPVVCAVNGVAAGAGANIALACDIVIAAKSAKFIQSFSAIGLIPDSGGTWVLPRLVGQMYGYRIDDFLMDIGTPTALTRAAEAWARLDGLMAPGRSQG